MRKKYLIYIITSVFVFLILIPIIYFNFYVTCSNNPSKYTQEKYSYRIDKKYEYYLNNTEEYAQLPGLKEHIIPQGITYSKKYNKILIVGYHKGKAAAVLFIIDYETGILDRTILLFNQDNTPLNTHIGGITTNDEIIWLSDNYKLYTLNLEDLINTKDMDRINVSKPLDTFAKGDYILYHDNFLYIGEYDYKIKYKIKESHHFKTPSGEINKSLIAVYDLSEETINFDKPDYLISVPDRIQGLSIDRDNNFILSRSFWSFQSSDISTFKNPLNGEPKNVKIEGNEYKLWFLDNDNLINNIKMPPMSEGIVLIDNELYLIFESASTYYKMYTKDKVSSIIKLNINEC